MQDWHKAASSLQLFFRVPVVRSLWLQQAGVSGSWRVVEGFRLVDVLIIKLVPVETCADCSLADVSALEGTDRLWKQ